MNNDWKSVTQLFKTKISGEIGGSPIVQNEIINSNAQVLKDEKRVSIFLKNPVLLSKAKIYEETILECIKEIFLDNYKIEFEVQKPKTADIQNTLPMFQNEETADKPKVITENSIKKTNLKKDLTLDNFIRSTSNDLAYAAAKSISQAPGTGFNPFFVYGNSGLGKTHLVNGIGLEIIKNFPNYKVLYTPFETFFNDFLETFNYQNKKASLNKNDFRSKYRDIDVLIIDDIQGISGREGTENEFFNTFNELYRENKQIILTSDVHPKEFKQLPDRILSRFNQGLVIDIKNPDYELRFNLIKKKALEDRINIDNDAIDFIVSNINKNMRELEGAYARVKIFLQTSGGAGTKETIFKALRDLAEFSKIEENVSPNKIIDSVCGHFKIKKEEIKKQDRSKKIAYPRQVCMYLLRKYTDLNYIDIARLLNRKDHTTIMHGVEKIEEEIQANSTNISNNISELKEIIFRR